MSDHIWQVTAPEREDGIYLFDAREDAEAFAEALTRADDPFAVGVEDTPINRGEGAAALVAAERGDHIEDAGMSAVAEDVREGIGLPVVLRRLAAIGEGDSEAAALLRGWRDQDTRRAAGGTSYSVDATDAAAQVERSMRGRLDDLRVLNRTAEGHGHEFSNEELEAVGLEFDGLDMAEDASERLYEYPLAVDTTITFEIVLGCGGPDDRLLVECQRWPGTEGSRDSYEVHRILYRYSWSGSAEMELAGEDCEVAEAFARRVVPELD